MQEAKAAVDKYALDSLGDPTVLANDVIGGRTPDGYYYVLVSKHWIATRWNDHDTVLYLMACFG